MRRPEVIFFLNFESGAGLVATGVDSLSETAVDYRIVFEPDVS